MGNDRRIYIITFSFTALALIVAGVVSLKVWLQRERDLLDEYQLSTLPGRITVSVRGKKETAIKRDVEKQQLSTLLKECKHVPVKGEGILTMSMPLEINFYGDGEIRLVFYISGSHGRVRLYKGQIPKAFSEYKVPMRLQEFVRKKLGLPKHLLDYQSESDPVKGRLNGNERF